MKTLRKLAKQTRAAREVAQLWFDAKLATQFHTVEQLAAAFLRLEAMGLDLGWIDWLMPKKGRLVMWGNLTGYMVRTHPECDYLTISYEGEGEELVCIGACSRKGVSGDPISFSMKDARALKLEDYTYYEKDPKTMLARKVIARLHWMYFPDAGAGIDVLEEVIEYPGKEVVAEPIIPIPAKEDLPVKKFPDSLDDIQPEEGAVKEAAKKKPAARKPRKSRAKKPKADPKLEVHDDALKAATQALVIALDNEDTQKLFTDDEVVAYQDTDDPVEAMTELNQQIILRKQVLACIKNIDPEKNNPGIYHTICALPNPEMVYVASQVTKIKDDIKWPKEVISWKDAGIDPSWIKQHLS